MTTELLGAKVLEGAVVVTAGVMGVVVGATVVIEVFEQVNVSPERHMLIASLLV